VKVVVTYHESSDFWGGLIAKIQVCRLFCPAQDMGYNLRRRHVFMYRLMDNIFDKIITVSNAVKKEYIQKTKRALEPSVYLAQRG